MPNRILRDWTDSFTINALDVNAERFFVRLIMKADDFGRFHADTRLLKASLFPLLPDTRESDISRWLAECEKTGLLRVYVDGRGRNYLEIANFKQRTRQSESKFPAPDGKTAADDKTTTGNGRSDDGQMTVNGRSIAHVFGDGDGDGDGKKQPPSPSAIFLALCGACGHNSELLGPKLYSDITAVEIKLKAQSVTANDIAEFRRRWDLYDWRGKKGESPTPWQVAGEWSSLMNRPTAVEQKRKVQV